MAVPYSIDLRNKILQAYLAKKGSQRQIAKRFKVSFSFIRDLMRQYQETGDITPKKQGGDRRSKLTEEDREFLKQIVTQQPDIYLREIQEILHSSRGIKVSLASLCNTLRQLNLPQKKSLIAKEQETERVQKLRHEWRLWLDSVDVRNLIFIDEAGIHLAMTRRYGRHLGGERVLDEVPRNQGKNLTLIGAMSDEGLIATMTLSGPLDTEAFLVYVEQILLPVLWLGAIVVMDNLPVHYSNQIKDLIESAGAQVKFLPPYSPDLSPIELCWSKLKEFLRSTKARTIDALNEAITNAIKAINDEDAINWFNHCGLFAESIK